MDIQVGNKTSIYDKNNDRVIYVRLELDSEVYGGELHISILDSLKRHMDSITGVKCMNITNSISHFVTENAVENFAYNNVPKAKYDGLDFTEVTENLLLENSFINHELLDAAIHAYIIDVSEQDVE